MIAILAVISVALALVLVAVVAYHLIGIYLALRQGRIHLEKLAGGLRRVRDDTGPLNGKIEAVNTGLSQLARPLLAANGNLARIVDMAGNA